MYIIRMINFDILYFQLQLLELPVDHILDPLLLRDVPHRGPQLPSQLQEQEQAILQAAQVTTNIVLYFIFKHVTNLSDLR